MGPALSSAGLFLGLSGGHATKPSKLTLPIFIYCGTIQATRRFFAQVIALCPAQAERRRCLISETLVQAFMIVKADVAFDAHPRILHRCVDDGMAAQERLCSQL